MARTKKDRQLAVVRPEKFESPNPVPSFSGTVRVSGLGGRTVKRFVRLQAAPRRLVMC